MLCKALQNGRPPCVRTHACTVFPAASSVTRKRAMLYLNAGGRAAIGRKADLDFARALGVRLWSMVWRNMPAKDHAVRWYPTEDACQIAPEALRTPLPEYSALSAFKVEIFQAFAGIGVLSRPPAGDVMPEFFVSRRGRQIYKNVRAGNIVTRKTLNGAGMYCHNKALVAGGKLGPLSLCSRTRCPRVD